jgi:hypothetical protein
MTEQLEIFFGALESIARAQRLLDREFATDFSVTELLRPDENRLSDVIACLLNPAGVHGQASCFLDLFIEMFKISCTADRTRCRVAREQGWLDILVEIGFGKRFGIGLENKPWAGDQPNQVRKYCGYLEKQFPGQWWFGYLSRNGVPPHERSICKGMREDLVAKGQFRTIPIARCADEVSIEDWLARYAEDCVAERVRAFLRDLQAYVGRQFH